MQRYGNAFIYFVLDWSQPTYAVTTVTGVSLLAIVCHTVLFAVYKLRVCIHDWCTKRNMVLPMVHASEHTLPISMVLCVGCNNSAC